jgi:hypothetical protein
MNEPTACLLRSKIFMDLPRRVPNRCLSDIPIAGGTATLDDRLKEMKSKQQYREPGHRWSSEPSTSDVDPRAKPDRFMRVETRQCFTKTPLKKSSDFGRPRRRCLDFLILIGAFERFARKHVGLQGSTCFRGVPQLGCFLHAPARELSRPGQFHYDSDRIMDDVRKATRIAPRRDSLHRRGREPC